jgi:hypothetical protein
MTPAGGRGIIDTPSEARPSIGLAAKYRGGRSIGREGLGIVAFRPSLASSGVF